MGLGHGTARLLYMSMQQPKQMGLQYGTVRNTGVIAMQLVQSQLQQKECSQQD